MESSPTGDWTRVPFIGRWIPMYWTTREVLIPNLLFLLYLTTKFTYSRVFWSLLDYFFHHWLSLLTHFQSFLTLYGIKPKFTLVFNDLYHLQTPRPLQSSFPILLGCNIRESFASAGKVHLLTLVVHFYVFSFIPCGRQNNGSQKYPHPNPQNLWICYFM